MIKIVHFCVYVLGTSWIWYLKSWPLWSLLLLLFAITMSEWFFARKKTHSN
jgi:hypothetical protein